MSRGLSDAPDELSRHLRFMRRLAGALLVQDAAADDLVQDAWIAAVGRQPATDRPLEPWLRRVLRNLASKVRRSRTRAAERDATALRDDTVPSPEDLLASAETQRLIVRLVTELPEPFRATVLLRHLEGLSSAQIARAQGVPAGTVRWRLKRGLDLVRQRLDERPGGRWEWRRAVLPLVGPGWSGRGSTTAELLKGLLLMKVYSKVGAAVVALVLLVLGVAVWVGREPSGEATSAWAGRSRPAGGPLGLPAGTADLVQVPTWMTDPSPPRRIAGRVTFAERPIVAKVRLGSQASNAGFLSEPEIATDGDGRFDFGLRPVAAYTVVASAPGYTSAAVGANLGNSTSKPAPGALELRLGRCDTALYGVVLDAGAGPVADAVVYQKIPYAPPSDRVSVRADREGRYEFCVDGGAGVGRIQVGVLSDTYGSVAVLLDVYGRQRQDFRLVPGGTVVGRVERADDGAAVTDAIVFLTPGEYSRECAAFRLVHTDALGRFRIAGVLPGRVELGARAGDLELPRQPVVVVEASAVSDEVVLRLTGTARIEGIIVQNDRPIAGASVAAVPRGVGEPVSPYATSRADGTFRLTNVPLGEIGFRVAGRRVLAPARVSATTQLSDIRIEVEDLTSLRGVVQREGRPEAGAMVVLGGTGASAGPRRTGGDGRFEFRGLAPGRYELDAYSGVDGAWGWIESVEVGSPASFPEVKVSLDIDAEISGVLVDEDGHAVAGARVGFKRMGGEDGYAATTAGDGTFSVARLAGAGDYRPQVTGLPGSGRELGPANGTFPLVNVPERTSKVRGVRLAVRLEQREISGRVVDGSGAAVVDAVVEAAEAAGGFDPWTLLPSSTTDVEGAFSIRQVPAATYSLRARTARGGECRVDGISAGRRDVRIVIDSPGRIDGTVAAFRGEVAIHARRPGAPVYQAELTADRFRIEGLAPGRYAVTAHGRAQSASVLVDVQPGRVATVLLRAAGSAGLQGRVVDIRSDEPAAGMTCRVVPTWADGRPAPSLFAELSAITDGAGRFELDEVPEGDLEITCWGNYYAWSDGSTRVRAPPGESVAVDVAVVARRAQGTLGGLGATFETGPGATRFVAVTPAGPAAAAGLRAGDRLVAVDGIALARLTERGMQLLLLDRPAGASVRLGIMREGRLLAATVVLGPPDT